MRAPSCVQACDAWACVKVASPLELDAKHLLHENESFALLTIIETKEIAANH